MTDDREHFTLTEDHLKLLRRMFVGWDGLGLGAPAIDSKRPYGNFNVIKDLAGILGVVSGPDEYEPFTPAQETRLMQAHRETETALQIVLQSVLRAAQVRPGRYSRECFGDWEEDRR